jgi:predicted Zn-dependent peptidase
VNNTNINNNGITNESISDEVCNYIKTYYTPNLMTLAVIGGKTTSEL